MSKQIKKKLKPSKKSRTKLKDKDPFLITKYRYAIYKCEKSIQLGPDFGNVVLPRGESMLMPVRLNVTDRKFIDPLEKILSPLKSGSKVEGKNILVIRYGGIGDIISSLYGIAELKAKYKGNVRIGYMTSYSNIPLLQCFPKLIDMVLGPITRASAISQFKYIVYLEDVIELSPEADKIPIHDVYAKEMLVNVDKTTTKLVSAMNMALADVPRRGIGIQYRSNAIIRDYDVEKTIELINLINDKYQEPVYLLGTPDDYRFVNYIQCKTEGKVIPNGCGLGEPLSLPQMLNLISTLKLVIGPDSSMVHMAGVCETPCIGLYGAFPSKLRLPYYKQAIGINGQTKCSPCFRHFPIDFCRYTNGEGVCSNSISAETIMEQVVNILGEKQTSSPQQMAISEVQSE